jgi:hypothetical protein
MTTPIKPGSPPREPSPDLNVAYCTSLQPAKKEEPNKADWEFDFDDSKKRAEEQRQKFLQEARYKQFGHLLPKSPNVYWKKNDE